MFSGLTEARGRHDVSGGIQAFSTRNRYVERFCIALKREIVPPNPAHVIAQQTPSIDSIEQLEENRPEEYLFW
jgi:hypothetical protein